LRQNLSNGLHNIIDKKNLKFIHEEAIGINYNTKESYINLDIKFFNVISDNHNDQINYNTFIYGREVQKHPKKEIALNIHLYKKSDVALTENAVIIDSPEKFNQNIRQRLREFFESFIKNLDRLEQSDKDSHSSNSSLNVCSHKK